MKNTKDQTPNPPENAESVLTINDVVKQIELLNATLADFEKAKPKLDRFDEKMCKLIDNSNERLSREIKAAFEKEIEEHWRLFFADLDYMEWGNGTFAEIIKHGILDEIKVQAKRLLGPQKPRGNSVDSLPTMQELVEASRSNLAQ